MAQACRQDFRQLTWSRSERKTNSQLEPGGYLEIIDSTFPVLCDDDSLPADSAFLEWSNLMAEASEKLGRSANLAPSYPTWLEEAGFTEITTRTFKWPSNRWPRDQKYKEIGAWTLTALDAGLEGLAMALFTRGLGWTQEQVLAFAASARKDMRNTSIHAYFNM